MRIPAVTGVIDRRILINYQVDKEILQKILPRPFQPKLVKGKGIAGICLIRLKDVKPKAIPFNIGVASENAAHRIAVEWTEAGVTKEGVYIPRRDTSSKINALAGGRIFPGVHHLASFTVTETEGQYVIAFTSDDGSYLSITAKEGNDWSVQSVFDDANCASDFFKQGAVGYSPTRTKDAFDGLELATEKWEVTPLQVVDVRSSFFEDESIFPNGTVKFDNALLMKDIRHVWKSKRTIRTDRVG